MKKKMFATGLAALFAASATFAADFTFSNEVSTRSFDSFHHSFKYGNDTVDYSKTKFAGFQDHVIADYDGDILKVGADAKFSLNWNYDNLKDDTTYYKVDWSDIDWYVEFKPFSIVSFGFSRELFAEGSHMFVLDEDIGAGNYSTDGFAVLIRPDQVEGLTIGAGFDYPAYFNDNNGNDSDPALAIGANYDSDQFSIGGSIHHLTNGDNRYLGVYGAIKAIEGLDLHVGFTHSKSNDAAYDKLTDVGYAPITDFQSWYWDGTKWNSNTYTDYAGIGGKNILSASLTYDFEPFSFGADLAVNLSSDDALYDLYSAAEFIFDLGSVHEGLSLDVCGFILHDFGDEAGVNELGLTWGVKPQIVFEMGKAQNTEDAAKHEFRAGIAFQDHFEDDNSKSKYWYISLPVSWKYTY